MKQVFLVILLLVLGSSVIYAQADEGVPLPGALTTHQARAETIIDSAQAQGNAAIIDQGASGSGPMVAQSALNQSSPLPGSSANYQASSTKKTSYQLLPISAAEAKTRIDELKTLLLISRPQSIQEQIYNLCDWLTEMYEAHNKLANAFGRQDETKGAALSERATAQKFRQLKNEAQLLKAELLIKQSRSPEALGSLVDIITADPKGATAKIAYQHLQELGFSENVPPSPIVKESDEQAESVKPTPTVKASKVAPPSIKQSKTATSGTKILKRSIVKVNR
jgi:hypothetical protein